MAQAVSYGSITIVDTNDIEEIYMIYAGSNNSDSMPTFTYAAVTGGTIWKRDASQVAGNYIWQSTVVTKSGVEITSSNWTNFYEVPVCITGPDGLAAKEISTIETQYCNYGDGTPGSSANWQSSTPAYDATKPNYWTRTRLKYDDNTYSSWTAPVKNQALTDAIYNAYIANSIATHAQEDAEGALSQSATLDVKLKNFFWPGGSNYPGAYAVGKGTNDGLDVENISTYGYNLRLTPITLSIGYNQFKAIEIDGSNPALKFYKPSKTTQGAQTAQLDANGLVLSEGGIEAGNAGQSGFIYLSTENYGSNLTINGHQAPNWKEIIGTKFGVDADGNLYASNTTISGAITATSLSTGTKTSETTGKGIFINSSGAIYSGDGNVNNFIINEYGAITAKSGTIGGWTIDSNSIHSDTKTAWDEDKNGIYMGRYSEGNNTIFAIAGGKIQYIESEDNSVQEDTIYYEKIKQLTNDETQDGAKDYYIKNGSEYIIVEQENRRSYFLTSDTTVKNKLYYTKNGDNYVVVDNPTGNPSAKGYYEMTLKNPKTSNWYEEIYQVVISPTGDPKQKGYYESAGPMWYIKSDGSASFGSLIVNRYGKLDVPAANITGMLTADQIEVSNLSAISTNIGSSVGQESTTNTLDVDTQIDYVLTNDERVNPNKTYYSLSLVDEEEGYVKVSNPSGNPKEQPYYEKINNSLIKLKTQKIFYKLTEDTTVVDGTDYYEFNTTPILTSDVEVNKSKDYYTVTVNSDGSFVSTLVIPNDTDNPRENKWYELNSSYDLINLQEVTGTINPKNKYWYIIDNIHSAEMSLLNAELNINANDKELLSIDSKVDSDEKIEVTNMSLSGGLSIGELILAPFDGGIAILV